MYKKIKVKKVEKKKLDTKKYAYLIFRYYKNLQLKEYIVCINYDFKTNSFQDGIILERLDIAYQIFNYLVNNKMLPKKEPESNNEYD